VQATKQQQIMGFFIEEAKEHLDTIEQGLLDLQTTMADPEQLNELFRAAHSVKGGAAMLGFDGIQKVGHHLEDYFKVLKENPIKPDRQLEDLFLKGFDALKELVEALQSPYGGQPDQAAQILQEVQPTFVDLGNYLQILIKQSNGMTGNAVVAPAPKLSPEESAFINTVLKKMLQVFKQGDSPLGRQQIATLCNRMAQLSPGSEWQGLLQHAQGAIADAKNSYQTLAPILIKELKQASDLLIAGRQAEIVPSSTLQQLASRNKPAVVSQIRPVSSTPAAAPPPPPEPPIAVAPVPPVAISTPRVPHETPSSNGRVSQISIPKEPRAAAKALLEVFNKAQLIELAEFIMKAIQ
jgi:chemotaxis protein histidine kinase CheA